MSAPGALRPVARLTALGLPAGWAPLPVGGGSPGWAAGVAAELVAEPDALDALAARLEAAAPGLLAGGHALVAVWVPDPQVPLVRGLLLVDVLPAGPAGPHTPLTLEADLDAASEAVQLRVVGRTTEQAQVPAGRALVVREVVAGPGPRLAPWRRRLEERTTWTVVPTGSGDAVRLLLSTPDLDLAQELAEHARAVAATLAVALGDPRGAPA